MIEGISHLTYIVKDLERASVFFREIFDAKEIYSSFDRTFSLSREKFFSINGQWIVIMEGESYPERTYNHTAFKIPEEEFDKYSQRIYSLGLDILPSRPRIIGEGRSLYFYDFDNHLFELHTGTISDRLSCYNSEFYRSGNITFTRGDADEAISIMREAAKWLIDIGKPMWNIEDFCKEKINYPPEEFIVLRVNGIGAVAMTLNFYDPFFWPNIERNTSGFIHKLSIRREFAGKGYAEKLIEHGKRICLEEGIHYLRLDCDSHREGLCRFYEKVGFKIKEIKHFNTQKYGVIDCAMYELKI